MSVIDTILTFSVDSFKRKLDMMTPELAKKVQYMGFESFGSRHDLIFKTSSHSFQFTVRLLAPVPEGEMMKAKAKYEDLYYAFREIKYEHLSKKK